MIDLAEIERRLRARYAMAREVLDAEGLGHVAALIPIEEVIGWIEEGRPGPCDAAIRFTSSGAEIRCHLDHLGVAEPLGHEGVLLDYAFPGSRTSVEWAENDRRTFHGPWPGPCLKPGPCSLPDGHHGRCAP